MKRKVIIIFSIAVCIFILAYGTVMVLDSLKFKKLELISYSYSTGGDMRGSYYSESIRKDDEGKMVLTIESAESHDAEQVITKYQIGDNALQEIRNIFNKYNMASWKGKKFTKLFVADGASHHYSFDFDNYEYISFSSQIFEQPYGKKLKEIRDVVDKYKSEGVPLD